MSSSTTKGYPFPEATDVVDIPSDIAVLASAVDAAPGITSYTQTQINALDVTQKWQGRIVFNTTTGKHQKSNGSSFTDLSAATYVQDTEPTAMSVGEVWLDTSASL